MLRARLPAGKGQLVEQEPVLPGRKGAGGMGLRWRKCLGVEENDAWLLPSLLPSRDAG